MLKILFAILVLITPPLVQAANNDYVPEELNNAENIESFLPIFNTSNAPKKKTNRKEYARQAIIPYIKNQLSEATIYNLSNAEQIFCYHVTKRPKEYTGYTLDNFAITDYCGELDMGQSTTFYEALFTKSPNIITAEANCHIEPQVILRFVRGVDYTDLLLSSPCPSFTIFYAGKYKSINVKQGVIDDIINIFKKREEFNSPALIKKTAANGEASNTKEAEQIEKKRREQKETMSWLKDDNKKETKSTGKDKEAPKKTGGWGNIKLKM